MGSSGLRFGPMSPKDVAQKWSHLDPQKSSLRTTPAKGAFQKCGLSSEDMRRFFYQTHTSATFLGTQNPEDAGCENFYDIHQVGQRDSKYMKYQFKRAPNWDRSLCEHTRSYTPHDISDKGITDDLAECIKSKQGVGRPKTQPAFSAVTKYTDDYKRPSRDQARTAVRAPYKPVIPVDEKGRPYHPLCGDKLLEIMSHEHAHYNPHPLDLAKAEKAAKPDNNLGPVVNELLGLPMTTAYREEYFSEKGVPRRPLRKPIRCKSAPAMRGPIETLPNWMRQAAATGNGWADSRVVPRPPLAVPSASSAGSQCRPRPASAGALGKSKALDRCPSAGRLRPPSAVAKMESNPQRLQSEGAPARVQRPASAGALRSSSSVGRS